MADEILRSFLNKTTGLFEPQTNKDISDFNYFLISYKEIMLSSKIKYLAQNRIVFLEL